MPLDGHEILDLGTLRSSTLLQEIYLINMKSKRKACEFLECDGTYDLVWIKVQNQAVRLFKL